MAGQSNDLGALPHNDPDGPEVLPQPVTATGIPPPPATFAVVAIGTSAGGLDAASRLFDALTLIAGDARPAMAFILIQHLDPTHPSLLAGLLAAHTGMTVVEACEGCALAADHVFVIPPGRYLALDKDGLRLTAATHAQGVRLPFDHLLRSLAETCGGRTVAVILTGTGADGSAGIGALKAAGGRVIAQDPTEAEYPGMPRSAIATGLVDQILRLADIPAALVRRARTIASNGPSHPPAAPADANPAAATAAILAELKAATAQDFSQYKPGTIGRRIARRMGLLGIRAGDLAGYLMLLRATPAECGLLARDLLINVTGFFRDPAVFAMLGETIVPDLLERHPAGQALRIWVAGCSTGEEAYSIAMVCREAIAASGRSVKLQIFASDIDADAIAVAREGLYTADIAGPVTAERLARWFVADEAGWRIAPTLRSDVVFTVQDLLVDPPFSRMDLVSCRNLLIYFNAEAQAKAILLFHFALCEGGVLLLGASETVGAAEDRFAPIAEGERFFRHIARSRPGEPGFPFSTNETLPRLSSTRGESGGRPAGLADLCARAVLAGHAPVAVLINRQRQVIYTMGAVARFLEVAPGYATLELPALVWPTARAGLRLAIDKAAETRARVSTGRARLMREGAAIWFHIDVEPLPDGDGDVLLVCFIEEPTRDSPPETPGTAREASRIAELESELAAAHIQLHLAIQGQETATQEQKAINEEALSVNEEFQSANEELLTSKEELQSLNEELTALNSQLQETLDRQRIASDDLQNVLYSTNVGTLFLDRDLKIRFFTPAIKALFNVIPGDIGRPLADLSAIALDANLLADARRVVTGAGKPGAEIACEVAAGATWFLRRIFPYLAHDGRVEGVVITFADITERKQIDAALQANKLEAERANLAKSRFLAAASHDLRQPLQSLTLLQELLMQAVEGERPKKLLARFAQTLRAMAGMLNDLLDINQIEAGAVAPQPVVFAVSDMLERLRGEFDYMAQARGLVLRMPHTSAVIESDPRLLEQMVRNLLGNAVKYTAKGGIVLGCRRRGDTLRIEVHDTGIGIAADELHAIFEEFHQVDNPARERSRGLGLGLSIVQRLGQLLGHAVDVRSRPGKGSIFAITVPLRAVVGGATVTPAFPLPVSLPPPSRACKVLVVDDDPDVRDLLEQLLVGEGYRVRGVFDGDAAIRMMATAAIQPEILLTDYNLPNGINGLDLIGRLRAMRDQPLPAIILTGDIAAETMTHIAAVDCVRLSKPVDPQALIRVIERLRNDLPATLAPSASGAAIWIVDDDAGIRDTLRDVLTQDGYVAHAFASAEAFLAAYRADGEACLLVDAHLDGMSGIELLRALRARGDNVPVILITGDGDIGLAVEGMRAGACDFIEKPVGRGELIASIMHALASVHDQRLIEAINADAASHVAGLTARQREVMVMVLAGHPSKNIAADLGISQRTVENHRAGIMQRMGVRSLPELARLMLRAEAAAGAIGQAPSPANAGLDDHTRVGGDPRPTGDR